MSDRFNVRVQVEINKLMPDSHAYTGERLSINEEFNFGSKSWSDIAYILGRFHGLAEKIQRAESGDDDE